MPAAQLARCLFPLGHLKKSEVRALAQRTGLHNYNRKDSTGICFIGERRFADFLPRFIPDAPGLIVDTAGRTVGEHNGLHLFTVGQRQGLGIGGIAGRAEAPWYVVNGDNKKRARLNVINHLLGLIPYQDLTPTPPALKPRPHSGAYQRTPMEDQTFVEEVW